MTSQHERRQYPRVSLTHVSVEVYDSGGELETPEFCFIINVSENGMLFKSDGKNERYKATKTVRLTFTLPDNAIVVRTDATIVHSQSTDLSVYVGVQFKNLLSSDQKSLQDFVQRSLEKSVA
jgi:c-di-GMP-binding flagellar brake protein YcgR